MFSWSETLYGYYLHKSYYLHSQLI